MRLIAVLLAACASIKIYSLSRLAAMSPQLQYHANISCSLLPILCWQVCTQSIRACQQ